MQFTLSYINLPHQTIDLDRSFQTMEALQEFVLVHYKEYTSYQVIVTAPLRKKS